MNNEKQDLNSGVSNLNTLSQTDFNTNNVVNIDNNIDNNVINTVNHSEHNNENSTVLYDTSAHINDVQTQKKEVKKATIKISYELKTAIIILVVLLIFIIFIPVIFDLFY